MNVILSVDAIQPPLTGIGHYAWQLAQGLPKHPAVTEVRYFAAHRWVADPALALATPSRLARWRPWLPGKAFLAKMYGLLQQQVFAWQSRTLHEFILHAPNYILPPWPGRSVATIHDLSHLHYPHFHPSERVAYLHAYLPRTLAQATHLITVSEFVRQEVINQGGVAADRVSTVYNGVAASFRPYPLTHQQPVLARYGLSPGQYLLSVATREPRKNLSALLEAYLSLDRALQRHYPLVFIGATGWKANDLETRLNALARSGRIYRLGYVPDADLPVLYAGARALAYPSFYEGFGLPVLEAMACGTPVLTSNRSALPEIAGGAAWLIDPYDVNDVRAGLERVLLDETWRDPAIERGLQRAQCFSWERCIQDTVALYQRITQDD